MLKHILEYEKKRSSRMVSLFSMIWLIDKSGANSER